MKTTILKPKHVTYADRQVLRSDNQVADISKMLGWTEQQYYDHQYDQYEEFLKRVLFGAHPNVYNKVRYSDLMRGLWNNEWVHRNTIDFLPFAELWSFEGIRELEDGSIALYLPDERCPEALLNEYEFIHSGQRLSGDRGFIARYHHVLELISKV